MRRPVKVTIVALLPARRPNMVAVKMAKLLPMVQTKMAAQRNRLLEVVHQRGTLEHTV